MSYIEPSFVSDNVANGDSGDGSYVRLPRRLNKSQARSALAGGSQLGVVGVIADDIASFRLSASIAFILDQDGEPIKVLDTLFSVGARVACAARPRSDTDAEIACIRALRQLGVSRVLSFGRADFDGRKYLRLLGVHNEMIAQFVDLADAPVLGVGANASTCTVMRDVLEESAESEGAEVLGDEMQAAFVGVSATVGVIVRELGLCYGALRYVHAFHAPEDLGAIPNRVLDAAVNAARVAPACSCCKA